MMSMFLRDEESRNGSGDRSEAVITAEHKRESNLAKLVLMVQTRKRPTLALC
jgi:hypothetical protein